MVIGQTQGAEAGRLVLADGGNAVDAAVTAALVAGVVALPSCGIGGYGGAMVIAMATGKVTAIDFNTVAPSRPPSRPHLHGWLSAGVPGILAGLDMALHRFGTRSFRQCVEPAIRYAEEGFALNASAANAIRAAAERFRSDAGSAKLYLKDGQPLPEGARFRNPDLGRMLAHLAKDNSTEAFYRGAIARRIAQGFAGNSGAVTEKDFHDYEAREVQPLRVKLGEYTLCTAPLTAGGATTLQALAALAGVKREDPARWLHARAEALRLAWQDRLALFGDPDYVKVPLDRLLSLETAKEAAKRIHAAVEKKQPIELPERRAAARGTIHLSAADSFGNMVALTLTHGDGFGACVTVDGLGLTLGHGMSRFEDLPGHPNAIGPSKRPLHNMCPTVVLRGRTPLLAVGGTGGRRIPNAVFDMLVSRLIEGLPLKEAAAAPRMNTTGGLALTLNATWTDEQAAALGRIGFKVERGPAATIQAVEVGERVEMAAG